MRPIEVLQNVNRVLDSPDIHVPPNDDAEGVIYRAFANVAVDDRNRAVEAIQRYVSSSRRLVSMLQLLLQSIRKRDKISAARQIKNVNSEYESTNAAISHLATVPGIDYSVFDDENSRTVRVIDECNRLLDQLIGNVSTTEQPRHRVQIIRTPTGQLSMIRPVAEKLLREGVISGALDGDLHAADAATVKAAVVTAQICDFCSGQGATNTFDVPDFEMPNGAGTSTDGWAACDECAALVRGEKKKALLDRAVEKMAFGKFTRSAIEELHRRFWVGMGMKASIAGAAAALADYVENRLPQDVPQPKHRDRDIRIKAVSSATGLTPEEVDQITRGEIGKATLAKLATFEQKFGKGVTRADVVDRFINDPKPPMGLVVPHWQRALDARFAALAMLKGLVDGAGQHAELFGEAIDLNDSSAIKRLTKQAEARKRIRDLGFGQDVTLLRAAATYSFSGETIAAIREAGRSLPDEAPLSSVETPNTGAGWFWFGEPMPVLASPMVSNRSHALLWGWVDGGQHARIGDAALVFSVYVLDENKRLNAPADAPSPSTRWYWPLSQSLAEMLVFNGTSWDETYGPGSEFADDPHIIGRDATLHCIEEMSRFFLMACVWFRQTVPGTQRKVEPKLTRENGHVERHARKRLAKEHKLDAPPTVTVVALRKTARTASEDAPEERQAGAREYSCRWIVAGHARMQACGPGRKDRKLIWIDGHVAGPEGMPLKTKEKVFAVVR